MQGWWYYTIQITNKASSMSHNNVSLVTGIWDLGRGSISDGGAGEGVWKRSFDHYIDNFKKLLAATIDIPLIVFIDPSIEYIVWEIRKKENTAVYHHKKDDFGGNFFPFREKVESIRTNPEWLSQNGWIKDSAQGQMQMYNPMVMSKMFLLNNAKVYNPFNSDFMFWIDGGITNTVHPGYFSYDKVIDKITDIVSKFLFICFPYENSNDIHGFYIDGMKKFAKSDTVDRVARGGFFGGSISYINKANEVYYSLLNDTLNSGYMGTEESIFTLMTYLDSDFEYESIDGNGLISTFFENLKNNNTKLKSKKVEKKYTKESIELYINTFNSPEQLQMVLDSFESNDKNFILKTDKILINNSTDEKLFEKYDSISKKYGFTEIRPGNLGVCGGRQKSAEMFKESGSKYMFFFEDDMLLDLRDSTKCGFGFAKKINNIYDWIIKLMDKESYDFIKLSFSEFYGHNGEQWSWHNVPEPRKSEFFGKINNRPNTKFNNIRTLDGNPYADGEVYYSNWPHIIGQEGNQKLFLDTTWNYPFEQTWMSHIYDLTIKGKIKPAILLASPITHNRVHFYDAKERKES
jgi:hypothetical protein